MRLLIDHRTVYRYEGPASAIVQVLRLTPRPGDSQAILRWRVDVEADGAIKPFTDAHGNLAHMFYADAPLAELAIHVEGEVLTTDRAGIVGAGEELVPLGVYLRSTPLTTPDAALAAFARTIQHESPLSQAHMLMESIHRRMAFDPDVTHPATDAATAFRLGRGVCQDLSQVMVTAARLLGIPARYVSGHYAAPDHPEQEAAHAWAELHLPGLGWVAFDPTHGICAGEGHVRVAVGLDSLDAAPVRGTRRGGGAERLSVQVHGRAAPAAPPADGAEPDLFAGQEQQEQRQ
ncbi:MAG: transglutaminase domain-containing protein [Thermaurantiacus tibetensis]|uniref:transglutaminase family protein n=1 Tax=Thermaurantiacus tibetensis TaxID=2759035 RepID=UPI00188E0C0C|nr:transglutaminase family protein [Thermaurantiacus tibetensis]